MKGITMAYRFAEKRNTIQEEMAFIVYMIIGSYFNKAVCVNQAIADRLYLYYAEMKTSTQEAKERKVILQAERCFTSYEDVLYRMNCEVVISLRENRYILDFVTGFERIHAEVDGKGNCEMKIFED